MFDDHGDADQLRGKEETDQLIRRRLFWQQVRGQGHRPSAELTTWMKQKKQLLSQIHRLNVFDYILCCWSVWREAPPPLIEGQRSRVVETYRLICDLSSLQNHLTRTIIVSDLGGCGLFMATMVAAGVTKRKRKSKEKDHTC